jgi:HEAT repeat protein
MEETTMKTYLLMTILVFGMGSLCRADLPSVQDKMRAPAIISLQTPEAWVQIDRRLARSPQTLMESLEEYLKCPASGSSGRVLDKATFYYVLDKLGDLADAQAIPPLKAYAEQLREFDAFFARVIIERIQARLRGRDEYIAEMVRWLHGKFPAHEETFPGTGVRDEFVERSFYAQEAARALGKLRAREAVPDIIAVYWEWQEGWYQLYTPVLVRSLAQMGDTRAAEVIKHYMSEVYAGLPVQFRADILEPGQVDPAWAYWQMRTKGMNLEQTVNAMVSALAGNDARQGVVEILTLMGRQVVPYLLKALAQPPGPDVDNAQFAVIRVLGNLRAPEAVEPLRQLLRESPSLAVKMACAWALGKIGDPCAIPDLVVLSGDDDLSLRAEAIRALGEMKHPQAIPPLLKVLREHPNEFTRTHAVSALESSGMRWLVPILEYQRMVEPSPLVQEYLADAVITLKQRR